MEFKEHLRKYLDESTIDSLVDTFDKKEHKGVLLNTNKMSDEEFIKLFPNVKKHPIVKHAYLYDQDEYELGKNIYHDMGCYYIQDPSAMLVSYFLNPKEGETVLDMCAAPGGKSVQASLLMHNKGVLYANDISLKRANILLSNIERLGLSNVVVSALDLSKINNLNNRFDKIILDAPCSGSGMFRKLDEMKDDWTYEKVIKNSFIQKELILLGYQMLKEGGELIYSTCSYSYEEDEEVIKYLLDNTDAELTNLPQYDGFYRSDLNKTIHLFPNKFIGEGHFIALIKKPGVLKNKKPNPVEINKRVKSKGGSEMIEKYSLPDEPILDIAKYALRAGLFIDTTINHKTYISHHYSHFLDSVNSYELNDDELKRYIHGESLFIKDNKNYTTVSYKGYNIGAVNKVNNELKNLYPKGLRR